MIKRSICCCLPFSPGGHTNGFRVNKRNWSFCFLLGSCQYKPFSHPDCSDWTQYCERFFTWNETRLSYAEKQTPNPNYSEESEAISSSWSWFYLQGGGGKPDDTWTQNQSMWQQNQRFCSPWAWELASIKPRNIWSGSGSCSWVLRKVGRRHVWIHFFFCGFLSY